MEEMTERTCATCAKYNGSVCTVDGFIMGSYDAACDYYCAKRAGGGKADMGTKCPNCGGRIDRIDKGKPPMRGVRYYCRHCDSTIIFLEKCGPKGVGHD